MSDTSCVDLYSYAVNGLFNNVSIIYNIYIWNGTLNTIQILDVISDDINTDTLYTTR